MERKETEERSCCADNPLSLSPRLLFSTNNLHDPILNTTYTTDFEEVENAVIRDSNYGWFLMTQCWNDIFFYNPETDVEINVPDLPRTALPLCRTLHFTSPPTSMDCQIIGVVPIPCYPDHKMISICTIKRNEESWTVHELPLERFFGLSPCKPILFKGVYYCLGEKGDILKYNPSNNNECSCHEPNKFIEDKLSNGNAHRYMVESDGELLVVLVDCEGRWVSVFRLDVEEMVFERVSNLGNKMLYVSNETSYSETAIKKGTENKIYLPRFHGKDSVFYSLDTNKFHTFAGYTSENLYGTKHYGASIWFKPNHDCTEEFEW